jgi:hypothetical protein
MPIDFARLARPLVRIAPVLEVVAIVGAVGGFIAGVSMCFVEGVGLSSDLGGTTTTHPYVGLGIAIALQALISGLFFWAVARGLRLLSADIADRRGIDLSSVTQGVVWQSEADQPSVELAPGIRVVNTYASPPRFGTIEAADEAEAGYFIVRLEDTGDVIRWWRGAIRAVPDEPGTSTNETPDPGRRHRDIDPQPQGQRETTRP